MNTRAEQAGESAAVRKRAGIFSAGTLLMTLIVSLSFLTIPRHALVLDFDFSEKAVLSYAHEKGLQFGTDIVWTDGPLGFLTSRYFLDHAAALRMAVDMALGILVAAGLCLAARRLRAGWGILLVGVFTFVASNIDARTDLLICAGLLFWGMICWVESGRRLAFSAWSFTLLAAFSMLVKADLLFIAGASVAAVAGDLILRGESRIAMGVVAGLTGGFVLGWVASGQSPAHLASYFTNIVPIIQGYDQDVGLDGSQTFRWLGLLTLLLAMATAASRALIMFETRIKKSGARRAVLLAWMSALIFMIWKHGVVRADLYHLELFFGWASIFPLTVGILPRRQGTAKWWPRGLALIGCLVPLFMLLSPLCFLAPHGSNFFSTLSQPFRAGADNFRDLLHPAAYREKMIRIEGLRRRGRFIKLSRLREIMGRSTVDVFGNDQRYAPLHDLNYHPRPVFQSYMAFNRPLMLLNERFFLSKEAPEYVLFNLAPIDEKFPPLEDALVFRDLLINYEPAAAEGAFLLLKSRASTPPRLTLIREGTVRPGEPIGLQGLGNSALWIEIHVEPTWLGRVRKFFYKSPIVRLAVWPGTFKESAPVCYRAPVPMLEAGFLASPLILNNDDLRNFYAGGASRRPAAYAVELGPGGEHFWRALIRFRIYRIENRIGGAVSSEREFAGRSAGKFQDV
jgi:hypothetical protein